MKLFRNIPAYENNFEIISSKNLDGFVQLSTAQQNKVMLFKVRKQFHI